MAVFDNANRSTAIALSNGDLTAASNNFDYASVLADEPLFGVVYWAFEVDTSVGEVALGVQVRGADLDTYVGSAPNSAGYGSPNWVWIEDAVNFTFDPYATGDDIWFVADIPNLTLDVYKNTTLQQQISLPALPGGADYYPAASLFNLSNPNIGTTVTLVPIPVGASFSPPVGAVAYGNLGAPSAASLIEATANWSGEFISSIAIGADVDLSIVADWSGEFISESPALPMSIDLSVDANWIGEFQSLVSPEEQQIIDSGFIGIAVVSSPFSDRRVVFPYEGSQPETLENRVSSVETLDGAHVRNRGHFHAGRLIQLALDPASREQIETAKGLLLGGTVQLSLHDGFYLCEAEIMDAQSGKLTMDLIVVEKISAGLVVA